MEDFTELSAEQAAAAGCAPGGHVLIVARPGSGKTFTLVARARRLLESGVEPEQVLAMTFSRRAAAALQDRLGRVSIQAGTFHAICADMLEHDGAAIGIRAPLRIVDERRGREFLLRALAQVGAPLPRDERARSRHLAALAARIERRKRRGRTEHIADPAPASLDAFDLEVLTRVDNQYCQLLREANAFDFADLVSEAVRLLRDDEATAERWRNRLAALLVDEFHDISPEQYELIRLLAPPRGNGDVFAVGDLDQAIFGWRDAVASEHFGRFRGEYLPRELSLTINYRSREPIVLAADQCMAATGHSRRSQPHRRGTVKPIWWAVPDEEIEARTIVGIIRQALASRHVGGHGSFAVLYRVHHVGDAIEAALIRAGMPLWRLQDDRFFDREDARESLRYLELGFYLADADLEPMLNWPHAIVDEITMTHLRRLADRHGLRLDRLIRGADDFADQISPLTRHALRAVVATADRDLQPLAERPMRDVLAPFLRILARRSCPTPAAKREDLRDTCGLLGRSLPLLVESLRAAMDSGRPIRIAPPGDPDATAAAILCEYVLRSYLEADVVCDNNVDVDPSEFLITCGGATAASEDGISIGPCATRTVTFAVAAAMWRLLQLVLMRYESPEHERVVVFDIETSSVDPRHAEILAYAAIALSADGTPGPICSSLVRPSHPGAIDRRATDIHGLRWRDVSGAPGPAACLPRLLASLDDAIVIGHNLDEFDLPVLRRTADRAGLPVGRMYSIDTRRMAQRLWPDEASYRLEDLARRLDPAARQRHRAHDDCLLVTQLFAALQAASWQEREIDVLPEALPLVAAATLSGSYDVVNDNVLLVELGARANNMEIGHDLLGQWRATVGDEAAAPVCRFLDRQPLAAPEEDSRWRELVEGWQAAVDAFEMTMPGGGIGEFLRYTALSQPIDTLPRSGTKPKSAAAAAGRDERVQLLTVHSAKGLEWDIVFLAGVEDDLFPHYRAATDEAVAEERRVFYVGMTRARDHLFLFSAGARDGRSKRASRFLEPLLGASVEVGGLAAATAAQPAARMA